MVMVLEMRDRHQRELDGEKVDALMIFIRRNGVWFGLPTSGSRYRCIYSCMLLDRWRLHEGDAIQCSSFLGALPGGN
jgi:hypothetical protein